MQTLDSLSSGTSPVTNLSGISTEKSLELASLCETVKISVTNLTPNCGPVSIPVRIVEPTMEERIEAIETAIWNRTTDPVRFQLLQDIYRIMQ